MTETSAHRANASQANANPIFPEERLLTNSTVNMASSLVNDNDNVNDMIKKLISVAELLYLEKDPLLDNDD